MPKIPVLSHMPVDPHAARTTGQVLIRNMDKREKKGYCLTETSDGNSIELVLKSPTVWGTGELCAANARSETICRFSVTHESRRKTGWEVPFVWLGRWVW